MALTTLLNAVIVTGASAAFPARFQTNNKIGWHAKVAGTGAVTATIKIEGSNDGTTWGSVPAITFTLSGTTEFSEISNTDVPYAFWRANLTVISGTGAAVTVTGNGAI